MTAFRGEDSWAAITPNAVYLITDSRYIEQARKECVRTSFVQRTGPITLATAQLVKRLKSDAVAIDKAVSLAAYQALRKGLRAPLKGVSGITEELRNVKDATELARIKKAAELSAKALARATAFFKPGICESELAGIVDLEIRRLGCKPGFETIVAFGPNASRPHHQPGARRLRKTDTIPVSYTHLRAHETVLDLVCRLLLEKKNNFNSTPRLDNQISTYKIRYPCLLIVCHLLIIQPPSFYFITLLTHYS